MACAVCRQAKRKAGKDSAADHGSHKRVKQEIAAATPGQQPITVQQVGMLDVYAAHTVCPAAERNQAPAGPAEYRRRSSALTG